MFPFLGVVPPNPADEVTTPNEIVLMEQMLALESTGVSDLSGGVLGGGGGGSSVTLVETLWTDDSLAYYVRADNGTAITWFTPTGVATTAPGTGIRPAGGASLILDTSRYQAIAAGAGFIIGDYLSHVVTADPATGVVIAFFWLNVTQNTKLAAAPSSASIAPITPLATGAATDSNLTTIAGTAGTSLSQPAGGAGLFGWLSGIYSKLSNPIGVAQPTAANLNMTEASAATIASSTGSVADAAYVTGSGSVIAVLKGIFTKLGSGVALIGGNAVAVKMDGSAVTQPVSIASMPSTAVTGTFWQATQPVSAAATTYADGWDVTQGTKADAAASNSTGAWSVVSLLKGLYAAMTAATPFGSNIIGYAGSLNFQTTPQVPAISASAYSSNTFLGALNTVPVFRNTTQPSATLSQFMLGWATVSETVSVTVFIFSRPPTSSITDKGTPAFSAADLKYLVTPPFPLAAAAPAVGSTQTFIAQSLSLSVKNMEATPTVNLYVAFVVGSSTTPAGTSDLVFSISGVQD